MVARSPSLRMGAMALPASLIIGPTAATAPSVIVRRALVSGSLSRIVLPGCCGAVVVDQDLDGGAGDLTSCVGLVESHLRTVQDTLGAFGIGAGKREISRRDSVPMNFFCPRPASQSMTFSVASAMS